MRCRGVEPREDGRVQPGRSLGSMGVHAASPDAASNYWHWARSSCWRTTSSRPRRTLVSRPSGSIAAQSAALLTTRDGPEVSLEQHVRMRRAQGQTVTIVDSGSREAGQPCFDFTTEAICSRTQTSIGRTTRPNPTSSATSGRRTPRSVTSGRRSRSRHVLPVDELIGDIKADQLPPVTWITPRYEVSEHPQYNFCLGEVVDAGDRRNHAGRCGRTRPSSSPGTTTAATIREAPPRIAASGSGSSRSSRHLALCRRGVIDHHLGEFSSVLPASSKGRAWAAHAPRPRRDGSLLRLRLSQPPRPQIRCLFAPTASPEVGVSSLPRSAGQGAVKSLPQAGSGRDQGIVGRDRP